MYAHKCVCVHVCGVWTCIFILLISDSNTPQGSSLFSPFCIGRCDVDILCRYSSLTFSNINILTHLPSSTTHIQWFQNFNTHIVIGRGKTFIFIHPSIHSGSHSLCIHRDYPIFKNLYSTS